MAIPFRSSFSPRQGTQDAHRRRILECTGSDVDKMMTVFGFENLGHESTKRLIFKGLCEPPSRSDND
jgi:hypothetical protein